MRVNLRLFYLFLFFLFSGCLVGPDYKKPEMDLYDSFLEAKNDSYKEGEFKDLKWWANFNDKLLNELVEEGVKNNKTVLQALSRINQLRALRDVSRAHLLPSFSGSSSYNRSKSSVYSSDSKAIDLYKASLEASLEVDIFGRLRRDLEVKEAQYEGQIASLEESLRILLAEIANVYFSLRGAQAQLKISEKNLISQKETLQIVKAKYQNGLVGELDVVRSKEVLETTKATIPVIKVLIKEHIHHLSVLVGKPPKELESRLIPESSIPSFRGVVNIKNVSDVLRMRPDIKMAERALAAYTSQIGVAEGELFPKVVFRAEVGVSANKFKDLSSGNGLYNFGPSISWNIFSFGALKNAVKAADEKSKEALLNYENTVLLALEEVENALLEYTAQKVKHRHLKEAAKASNRAYVLAKDQYKEGVLGLLAVLDAQRIKLKDESNLATSEVKLSTSLVSIYKALGRGWDAWEISDIKK